MSEDTKKLRFSMEEFDIMLDELLYQDPISYDMLFVIAKKILMPKFRYLCSLSPNAKNRGFEEDLMQLSMMRLCKYVVTGFLKRPDKNGVVNKDPVEFTMWVRTVGNSVYHSNIGKLCDENTVYPDDSEDSDGIDALPDVTTKSPNALLEEDEEIRLKRERIQDAFDCVLSPHANLSVYKVITWIAVLVYIAENDLSKIEATHFLEDEFKNKTLLEMYSEIVLAAVNIPWLEFSEAQHAFIRSELNKEWKDGIIYADVCYGEFSMNGGLLKSISDWFGKICKKFFREKTPKKETEAQKDDEKKGEDDDGTFDA